jgi:putative tryptophan/tyrosine transport system substrate-binding protein
MAAGPEAARAAQKATQYIPIVALADDLLGSKLVASMPHPKGNTTGVAIFAFQLDAKRLELLHEALSNARRIAVLADHEPIPSMSALESAAQGFGIEKNGNEFHAVDGRSWMITDRDRASRHRAVVGPG